MSKEILGLLEQELLEENEDWIRELADEVEIEGKDQSKEELVEEIINSSNNLGMCPRCMGKGYIDMRDIRRLGNRSRYGAGSFCRYCEGSKQVPGWFPKHFDIAVDDPISVFRERRAAEKEVAEREAVEAAEREAARHQQEEWEAKWNKKSKFGKAVYCVGMGACGVAVAVVALIIIVGQE